MATTDKRKAAQREASKNNWKNKKAAGWKRMYIWFRPEQQKEILEFVKKLKEELKNYKG